MFSMITPVAMSQDLTQSPLPACPESPNCIHQAHAFSLLPSELTDFAIDVLRDMGAESIDVGTVDHHELAAVFKVWFFKDDVQIYVMPAQDGSMLYIRSASREGYSDLGVNKRRVNRFMKRLNQAISQSTNTP